MQDCRDCTDNDSCRDALLKLPKNTKSLFFHALQSRIFNSIRVGNILQPGDVVEDADGKILLVDQENARRFTIFDRVAPLVGFGIYEQYREVFDSQSPVIGQVKHELALFGIDYQHFPCPNRDFISPGNWRKLQNRPVEIRVSIEAHDDILQEFAEESRIFVPLTEDTSIPSEGQKYTSVIAKFELPPSVYATELISAATGEDYSIEQQKDIMKQYEE